MSVEYEPSVSVIVAAYNARRTIDDCVASLLDLRYPATSLELLVVDNASTDGTAAALRRHEGRVRILRHDRRGAGAARNAGLAAAEGEVVAFTDADCVVDPDWLASLVVPLRRPEVGVAGGAILARPPAGEVERFGETIHDHRRSIQVFRPPYAITMSWASRLEVLRRLGGFDERFIRCQDVELSYRILQAGYSFAFVDDAIVYHRNERTLLGLFREGFQHGFHSVRTLKRHDGFVRAYGHRRVDRRGYAAIGSRLVDWARGRDRARSRCDAVFNSGKKAGKLLGSARFGHLDL